MDLIFTDLNSTNNKVDLKKLVINQLVLLLALKETFLRLKEKRFSHYKGVQAIKINENILRSETAVISAISIINYAIN